MESDNLKIIYVKETLFGSKYSDEITITDKRNNLSISFISIDELKNYINKNA